MIPAIKSDGTEYYEYFMVYVSNVIIISCVPMKKIEIIKCIFKLKGEKSEPPDMYLGAPLEEVKTKGGTKCWWMYARKYVKAAVVNLEATLAKIDMRVHTSNSPMPKNNILVTS